MLIKCSKCNGMKELIFTPNGSYICFNCYKLRLKQLKKQLYNINN